MSELRMNIKGVTRWYYRYAGAPSRLKNTLWMPLLLVVLLGYGRPLAGAQQSRGFVEGQVFDYQTQEPLMGVNILVEGTLWGDSSDSLGYFRIGPIPARDYDVTFQMIGFQVHSERVRVVAGESISVRVMLRLTVLEGREVEVERPRYKSEPWRATTPSSFPLQIKQVETLPGAFGDVLRVLQTLPGVLVVNDFSNQLIVRGGSPNQNLILLDGIELFSPYKGDGMMSVINPAILENVTLYTGGFPALFGDRLSSVLAMTVREGPQDYRLGGEIGASLSGANLVLEGKTRFMDGSWLVSARRTFFELFADSLARSLGIFNEVAYPRYEDIQAKIVLRPRPGHSLQVLGLYNRDGAEKRVRGTVGEQGSAEDQSGLRYGTKNLVLGGTWIYAPTPSIRGRIYANGNRTWGHNGFRGAMAPRDEYRSARFGDAAPPLLFDASEELEFSYEQHIDFQKLALGTSWIFRVNGHTLEVGAGGDFLASTLDADLELNEFGESVFDALLTAPNWLGVLADSIVRRSTYRRWHGFLQDKWELPGERLLIQPSLRYDYYEVMSRGYLSPRVNFSLLLNTRTTLRGAWGRYVQSPGYEKLYDSGDPLDLSRYQNLDGLAAEKATHIVMGLRRELGQGWHLNIDGYWKSLEDLIIQQVVLTTRLEARYIGGYQGVASFSSYRLFEESVRESAPIPVNGLQGRSYGLDLLLEKRAREPLGRWYGWLAYAYGYNVRERTIQEKLIAFPSEYDRRHAVNLVLHHRFGRQRNLSLGLTWRYGTGLPYTPALSVKPLIISAKAPGDTVVPVIMTDPETGYVRFIPTFGEEDNVNSGRLPDYHRMDIRLSYQLNGVNASWEFYLDLINVYNRRNTFYYRNIIIIEEDTREGIPLALRRSPTPVLYREPVYMYPFIPSLGFVVSF